SHWLDCRSAEATRPRRPGLLEQPGSRPLSRRVSRGATLQLWCRTFKEGPAVAEGPAAWENLTPSSASQELRLGLPLSRRAAHALGPRVVPAIRGLPPASRIGSRRRSRRPRKRRVVQLVHARWTGNCPRRLCRAPPRARGA